MMSAATKNPKGWYSRGYLPHLDAPNLLQFVTFRLADALPRHAVERMYAELKPDDPERLRRIERYLDAGNGACWLNRPEVADIVESTLLHGDGEQYRMIGWVIMPNHVHLLAETMTGFPLPILVQAWKSVSARRINQLLERAGAVWARDYFDRYIRDERHWLAVIQYIDNNPVKAGLAGRPEDWPHGSARFHIRKGAAPTASVLGTADASVGVGAKRR